MTWKISWKQGRGWRWWRSWSICDCKNSAKKSENYEIVHKDRRLIIWLIAHIVNTNKEAVWQILLHKLDITNMCAKIVTQEQQDSQKNIRADIMERLTEEPDFQTSIHPSMTQRRSHNLNGYLRVRPAIRNTAEIS